VSEVCYLLGTIAREFPDTAAGKPLALFKRGLEAVAKEPVTELTWQLAYALGQEYHARGQGNKAAEYLQKAGLVLAFFLSHFGSDELRKLYLASGDRAKVLGIVESYTTT
jgi:hypothetical protein